jgi:hypothetical protein
VQRLEDTDGDERRTEEARATLGNSRAASHCTPNVAKTIATTRSSRIVDGDIQVARQRRV